MQKLIVYFFSLPIFSLRIENSNTTGVLFRFENEQDFEPSPIIRWMPQDPKPVD